MGAVMFLQGPGDGDDLLDQRFTCRPTGRKGFRAGISLCLKLSHLPDHLETLNDVIYL